MALFKRSLRKNKLRADRCEDDAKIIATIPADFTGLLKRVHKQRLPSIRRAWVRHLRCESLLKTMTSQLLEASSVMHGRRSKSIHY